jgi:hypothetical protein
LLDAQSLVGELVPPGSVFAFWPSTAVSCSRTRLSPTCSPPRPGPEYGLREDQMHSVRSAKMCNTLSSNQPHRCLPWGGAPTRPDPPARSSSPATPDTSIRTAGLAYLDPWSERALTDVSRGLLLVPEASQQASATSGVNRTTGIDPLRALHCSTQKSSDPCAPLSAEVRSG